ncbi:MAG: cytochrome C oxidase subunit II [Candidatus Eremiobacteraeota bacterium]|nr:cytochrome C oxidase subunit II [Candidatus Eremiobacteraeota bacterium]
MHMLRLEKAWIALGLATMAAFFITLITLAVAADLNTPNTDGMTIDPAKVMQTPPFDKPGLHQIGPHLYEAYYVGQIFSWRPNQLSVPAGSTVKFFVTAVDVVHGFTIPDADVNLEIMPGWVSEVDKTFKTPGDYLILCNQYCGAGHAGMYAHIEVTP